MHGNFSFGGDSDMSGRGWGNGYNRGRGGDWGPGGW